MYDVEGILSNPKVVGIIYKVAEEWVQNVKVFADATQWVPQDHPSRAGEKDELADKWYSLFITTSRIKGTSTQDIGLRRKLAAVAEVCHLEDAEPYILAGYFDPQTILHTSHNDIDPSLLDALDSSV